MKFAAALLAGGRSRRMGRDKALIKWEGTPLWQFQLSKLRELNPARLLISCREEQGLQSAAEFVFDPPGSDDGPLGAITRCLELVQMPLLVLAVDMPWMTTSFLRAEVLRGGFFRGDHGFEALAAVYEPRMLPAMQEALQSGRLALQRVIEACEVEIRPILPEQANSFRNANSENDLKG